MRATSKKRISMGNLGRDNMVRNFINRKKSLGNYMIMFLDFLADNSPQLLAMLLDRIEGIDYGIVKIALEKMLRGDTER